MDKVMKGCPNFHFQGVKVLYVEDESFSREKLLRILERRFEKVIVATDGEEGYKFYQRHQPDLVIADIKTGKMNGLEMIEKIRQQNNNTQIIITTAYEDSEYLLQSIEYNVNHFIIKPIDLNKLLAAIQKSIDQIQLEKKLEKQKKRSRIMMDFQDNLIFVVENEFIMDGNRAFSSFTGIDNIPGTKVNSLSKLFVDEDDYFYPKNPDRWWKEFLEVHNKSVKVKWIGKNEKEAIYLLKATMIPDEGQYLFVCTDITQLENESKKNEWLATLDPLTKIYNRQKFDDILCCEMKHAERYHHKFSAILFEIDHFSRINEKFGQQNYDDVLKTLSTIVQQRIRETDVFARWGEAKFIILTPDEAQEGAAVLAESLRQIIGGFSFPNVGYLTCSFGVAECILGKSKKQFISELSGALYLSKNRGENCVTVKDANEKKEGVSGA